MTVFLRPVLGILLLMAGSHVADAMERIPLEVIEPAERRTPLHDFPVSVGMIFPKGELTSVPGGRLMDDQGKSIPFEAEATGWWEKEGKNIKWLLLHFEASTDRNYFFAPGKPPSTRGGDAIARRRGGKIEVNTGPLSVDMDPAKKGLFQQIRLNDRLIATSGAGDLTLTVDDGSQPVPLSLGDWTMEVEQSTPMRASIKASGVWQTREGRPVARVNIRCTFYQGKAFFRIHHTLTWMVRDVKYGIRELSLGLTPRLAASQEVRVGLNEYSQDAFTIPCETTPDVTAYQDTGDHFVIKSGNQVIKESETLGGWISLTGKDGRGMALSLRHAWQRYPVAFSAQNGQLEVQFCPQNDRLSFEQEAIMTSAIYNHPCWKGIRKAYKAPTDVTHFYDNYSDKVNLGYLYTAEGAAFTHELLVSFHEPNQKQAPAALNSIVQHPIVIRQAPSHAMRVPFMGFNVLPYDAEKYPEFERAIARIGKMSMARWVSAANFGLLRFGMTRWAMHERIENPNASFYRWMDGTQYNQQLIPWLLYMRGGDRSFLEDAEITSRFAMDLHVNHFNTRGSPTGYMAGAGSSLPFNPFSFMASNLKMQKIHFLAYHYHLTGDLRAKEVMEEIIEGTKEFTLDYEKQRREKSPGEEYYYLAGGGRENYNMNVFWVNAWEETFDPEILKLAENNRKSSILGEYQPAKNTFGGPQVYLYEGLVPQQKLSGDEKTRDIMLRHLAIDSLSTHGGVHAPSEDSIVYPWAYDQTGDERYAEAAWDVARSVADLVPDIDFDGLQPPAFYPKELLGNSLFRNHLMPILTGAKIGDRLGFKPDKPRVFRDQFFQMWPSPGGNGFRSEVYVRARRDGALTIRCLSKGEVDNPLHVEITKADGSAVLQSHIDAKPGQTTLFQEDLIVESAKAGEVFLVTMQKIDRARTAVIADAQVVHHLPSGLRHSHESLGGAQNGLPVQFCVRAKDDTVGYLNKLRRSYAIRDAKTSELIFRPRLFTDKEAMQKVGAGRLILVTSSGCRAPNEWIMQGVEPYYSAKLEDWFNPVECGMTNDTIQTMRNTAPQKVMNCIRCAAIVAAAASSGTLPAQTTPGNLLINGNFEQGEAGPIWDIKMLEGWPSSYGNTEILSLRPEPRPGSEGKMSLKIDSSEKPGTGGVYSGMVAIDPAKPLQITGWIREEAISADKSKPYIGVAWYDQDQQPIAFREGTSVNYRYVPYSPLASWQEVRFAFTPPGTMDQPAMAIPENAAYCQLRLFVIKYTGAVWLDDFEIRQETASADQ